MEPNPEKQALNSLRRRWLWAAGSLCGVIAITALWGFLRPADWVGSELFKRWFVQPLAAAQGVQIRYEVHPDFSWQRMHFASLHVQIPGVDISLKDIAVRAGDHLSIGQLRLVADADHASASSPAGNISVDILPAWFPRHIQIKQAWLQRGSWHFQGGMQARLVSLHSIQSHIHGIFRNQSNSPSGLMRWHGDIDLDIQSGPDQQRTWAWLVKAKSTVSPGKDNRVLPLTMAAAVNLNNARNSVYLSRLSLHTTGGNVSLADGRIDLSDSHDAQLSGRLHIDASARELPACLRDALPATPDNAGLNLDTDIHATQHGAVLDHLMLLLQHPGMAQQVKVTGQLMLHDKTRLHGQKRPQNPMALHNQPLANEHANEARWQGRLKLQGSAMLNQADAIRVASVAGGSARNIKAAWQTDFLWKPGDHTLGELDFSHSAISFSAGTHPLGNAQFKQSIVCTSQQCITQLHIKAAAMHLPGLMPTELADIAFSQGLVDMHLPVENGALSAPDTVQMDLHVSLPRQPLASHHLMAELTQTGNGWKASTWKMRNANHIWQISGHGNIAPLRMQGHATIHKLAPLLHSLKPDINLKGSTRIDWKLSPGKQDTMMLDGVVHANIGQFKGQGFNISHLDAAIPFHQAISVSPLRLMHTPDAVCAHQDIGEKAEQHHFSLKSLSLAGRKVGSISGELSLQSGVLSARIRNSQILEGKAGGYINICLPQTMPQINNARMDMRMTLIGASMQALSLSHTADEPSAGRLDMFARIHKGIDKLEGSINIRDMQSSTVLEGMDALDPEQHNDSMNQARKMIHKFGFTPASIDVRLSEQFLDADIALQGRGKGSDVVVIPVRNLMVGDYVTILTGGK